MSRLCCRERIPPPSEAVSIHLLNRKKNILTSNTVQDVLVAAQEPINNVVETVGKLSLAASKMPYYKFNNMWSRQMQSAVCFGVDFSLHRLSTDKTAG
jgi:hypothetical protein